jgi:hypothetical protein
MSDNSDRLRALDFATRTADAPEGSIRRARAYLRFHTREE